MERRDFVFDVTYCYILFTHSEIPSWCTFMENKIADYNDNNNSDNLYRILLILGFIVIIITIDIIIKNNTN